MIGGYSTLGWRLVPVRAGLKRPSAAGWTEREFGPADFPADGNVAVQLGPASGGLADTNLDASEAIVLANTYLPATNAIFGRRSKPRSHWLYVARDAVFEAFSDPIAGDVLLEIRSD